MKLDGHRRLVSGHLCWSRSRRTFEHPEIQAQIPEGWLLDGEIVPVDCVASPSAVSSRMASAPDKLKFVAFDVLFADGKDVKGLPWSSRRALLEGFFTANSGLQRVELSPVYYLDRLPLSSLIERAAERRLEGVIIKDRFAPYKPGSRSAWIKHKFVETHDVVVTGCAGPSSQPGCVGLEYGFYDQAGALRTVGALGVTGPRSEMIKRVGDVVEVRGTGPLEKSGAIRHPVLIGTRKDKEPAECVRPI